MPVCAMNTCVANDFLLKVSHDTGTSKWFRLNFWKFTFIWKKNWGFPAGLYGKKKKKKYLPAMQETWV